tara:strand:- start:2527 stop:3180 length:654 start_codon:yes stop_codon:yes gene_type:complete
MNILYIFSNLIGNILGLYTKMTYMIKQISIFITLLVLISPAAFPSEGPDDFLKKSVQEITALVSEHKERFTKDENFLRSKMNSVVMPKLDITLMSKIILGKKIWTGITSQQKTDFIKAFKFRMTSTYMKSITVFDGEKIEFLPYVPGKKSRIALVKSKYLIATGDIDVDYRLIKNNDGWRVYDIIFEGISLMKNYRADFRQHVSKNGIDSLIESLSQ